jgi:hypothetical protein
MWKIITRKKWNEMVKEMEELRGAHLHLHELHKGLYNKSLTEKGDLEAGIKERDEKIAQLETALRKAEHERNEAFKKLRKYEARRK